MSMQLVELERVIAALLCVVVGVFAARGQLVAHIGRCWVLRFGRGNGIEPRCLGRLGVGRGKGPRALALTTAEPSTCREPEAEAEKREEAPGAPRTGGDWVFHGAILSADTAGGKPLEVDGKGAVGEDEAVSLGSADHASYDHMVPVRLDHIRTHRVGVTHGFRAPGVSPTFDGPERIGSIEEHAHVVAKTNGGEAVVTTRIPLWAPPPGAAGDPSVEEGAEDTGGAAHIITRGSDHFVGGSHDPADAWRVG